MSFHVSNSSSNRIDHDEWWEEWINNDSDINNESTSSLGRLRKFHDRCSCDFFNENDDISKGRFFQVCCFTWMQDFLGIIIDGDDNLSNTKITPKMLWKILKQIYTSGCKENAGIIKWILPDPSVMTALKLTDRNNDYDDDDNNNNDNNNNNVDMRYTSFLMEFWRDLFQMCDNNGSAVSSSSSSSQAESAVIDENTKRPSKRRRLGLHRSSSGVGFTGLLKGRYKLPAVYLLVSLLKETGVASNWDRLCLLAHGLPTIFKTFAESDIRAGLALVGLAGISTGQPITGLSTSALFTTYLSRVDSYGLSILSILQDATALDLYNLRAFICRQTIENGYDDADWSEEYKSEIIESCAGCIDQEHPKRFVDDIDKKQRQQLLEKRRRRKKTSCENPSVPKEVMASGFPLLVHIQIWLHQHHVERAAELTRKMDSSSSLDDEVKDKAWLEIWNYLLANGSLFLDGNIETPGYLKKRDFMYNFMACQEKNAKENMMDFFEGLANRVYDQKGASMEEKQYVLLACQQTVLRLLLKMRGLGSVTILEFVKETKWPVEIDGHNAAKDLNEWGANFLRQTQKIPSTLIDETTGLVDLLRRYERTPKTDANEDKFDDFLLPESPSVPVECATEEKVVTREESFTGDLPTTNVEAEQLLYQEEFVTDTLETKNDVYQEENYDHNIAEGINEEVYDDDDEEIEVLDVDDDDDDEEVEVLDVDDESEDEDEDEDGVSRPHVYVDDDADKEGEYNRVVNDGQDNYLVDDEDCYTDDEDERQEQYDDGEDSKDVNRYHREEEIETLDDDDDDDIREELYHSREDSKEAIIHEYEKEIKMLDDDNDDDDDDDGDDNDDDDDDDDEIEEQYHAEENPKEANIHECEKESEILDDDDDDDEGKEQYNVEENRKEVDSHHRDEESEILNDDDDDDDDESVIGLEIVDDEDNDHDNQDDFKEELEDADGVVNYNGVESRIKSKHSDNGQAEDISTEKRANEDSKDTDTRQKDDSISNEASRSVHETNEAKQDVVNESDATDDEHEHIQRIDKIETEVAAVGGEFGDTTEEEDGNEKFRANRTAQANLRADATSTVGYASQVEDGYEPEDTHGYTEEEVSEAIHTEDEEDERMRKQKSHANVAGTVQHSQTGPTSSHTNNEGDSHLRTDQSRLVDGSTDRQQSPLEPASDDMDMADEHTEQEDDIGAEFSELEENQEGTSDAKLMSPRSPPASADSKDPKTLLDFAQSAQKTHDWTRHAKEAPPGPKQVDSNNEGVEEKGQMTTEGKSIAQETKSVALSFDADDENYATEGCKSLETEDESVNQEAMEDTENDTDTRIDRASIEEALVNKENDESLIYADSEDELQSEDDDDEEIDAVSTTNDEIQGKAPEEIEKSEGKQDEIIVIDSEDDDEASVHEEGNEMSADEDVGDGISGASEKLCFTEQPGADEALGNDESAPSTTKEAEVQEESYENKDADDDDDLKARTNENNVEYENSIEDKIHDNKKASHSGGSEGHHIDSKEDVIIVDKIFNNDVGGLEASVDEKSSAQKECDANNNAGTPFIVEPEARDGDVIVMSHVEDGGQVQQDNYDISEEKNVDTGTPEPVSNEKATEHGPDDVDSDDKPFKDTVDNPKAREENKHMPIEVESSLGDNEVVPAAINDQSMEEDAEDEVKDDEISFIKDKTQPVAVHMPESPTTDNAQAQKQDEMDKTMDEDDVIDSGPEGNDGSLSSKDEIQPNTDNTTSVDEKHNESNEDAEIVESGSDDEGLSSDDETQPIIEAGNDHVDDDGGDEVLPVAINDQSMEQDAEDNVKDSEKSNVRDETQPTGVHQPESSTTDNAQPHKQDELDETKDEDQVVRGALSIKNGSQPNIENTTNVDVEQYKANEEAEVVESGSNRDIEALSSDGSTTKDIEDEKRKVDADLEPRSTEKGVGIETIESTGNKDVEVELEVELETEECKDAMMDVEEDFKEDMMIDDNDQQGINRDCMKEDTDADTDVPMNEIPTRNSVNTVTGTDLEDAKDRTNQDSLNEDTTMNDVIQLTDRRNQSENDDENSDREESDSDSSDEIVIVDQPEKEESNDGNRKEEEMEVENDISGPSEQFLARTVDDEKTGNFVTSKECQEDEKAENSEHSNSCSNDEVNDPLDSRDDIMIKTNKEETVENEVVPVKDDSKSYDALDDTTDQIPKEKKELRLEPGNTYQYLVGDVVDLKSAHKGYVDKARITAVNPDNTYDVKINMTGHQKKSVKPEQIIESSKNADLANVALVHDEGKQQNVDDTNEAGPSDIPQFIGGEPKDEISTPTRKSTRKRKTGRTDDERSVSTSSRSMRSKQGSPASRSSKQGPGTLRRTGEEEESGEEKSVNISVGGSVRSTASRPKRGAARRGIRNKDKDEDSTAPATKKSMIRAGLPPRPPKDVSKNTKNIDIENDDEVSVKSRVSTRSRSSTTARSSKQKKKNVDNDDNNDDEVSVQSRISTRSRSSTARSSKQKNNAAENDNDDNDDDDDDDDDDEASVQSRVSVRSRSSAARSSKQEAKLSSITEDTIQNNVDFSKMTVKELQSECRKRKISYTGLRKAALIEKLQSTMD